jgi:hypothetical protein
MPHTCVLLYSLYPGEDPTDPIVPLSHLGDNRTRRQLYTTFVTICTSIQILQWTCCDGTWTLLMRFRLSV